MYIGTYLHNNMYVDTYIHMYIHTHTYIQIILLLCTVLHQNYFQFSNDLYKPLESVAVGCCVSGLVVEIFMLQYYENLVVKHMIETKTVIFCNGFFYDFLVLFGDTEITTGQLEEQSSLYVTLILNLGMKNKTVYFFLLLIM